MNQDEINTQGSNEQHHHQGGGQGYHDWRGAPPAPPNPWDLEKRVSMLEQSTKTIKDELSKINSNLSKLVWIVITAVVLATLNVAMSGGIGG